MSTAWRFVLVTWVAACSGDPSPPTPPAEEPSERVVRAPEPASRPVAKGKPLDASGMHLDDPVPGRTGRSAPKRAARPVEITLRSTPPGATVSVDGVELGVTPQLWEGPTGKHEFTFTLPGHAMARYRFHVTTSGLVHARLDPVAKDIEAGKPPPELVPPAAPTPSIVEPVTPKLEVAPPSLRPSPPRLPPPSPVPVDAPGPMLPSGAGSAPAHGSSP